MSTSQQGAVLITGASTGIGKACALRLDRTGWRVFAGVRKRGHAEQLAEEGSERLEPVIIDVTDEGTIGTARERIEQETGGRLAGLVNNAGIGLGGPVEFTPLDDYRRQLEVNVFGQIAVTQAFLPMLRAAQGRVVFISSIAGRDAIAFMSAYSASKHAIEAIADSLRQEMKPFGVEISLVEPGSIATPIWEKAEEEVARTRELLGEEGTRLYGKRVDAFDQTVKDTAAAGISPDEVAKVVEHALSAAKPKTRYLVGRDAKQRAIAKKLVSDRMMDRLVAREMGI